MIRALILMLLLLPIAAQAAEPEVLLNVSFDPTREFYREYNALFACHWRQTTGQEVRIRQSHGGSGAQARSVAEGLKADVVTLALGADIDAIARRSHLVREDWRGQFPNDASPYASTVVFLVRKDNPKHIRDWDDLIRPGVAVMTPNPRTSGGARLNYLAAWGYALKANDGDEEAAARFMTELFRHVPVLDAGARAATTSFVERGQGDALVAWESEALFIARDRMPGEFEIVAPRTSILAPLPVAVVEGNAARHGAVPLAREYLAYLYSAQAQVLAARFHYRPYDTGVAKERDSEFTHPSLFTVESLGGWDALDAKHFASGALFDRIGERLYGEGSKPSQP